MKHEDVQVTVGLQSTSDIVQMSKPFVQKNLTRHASFDFIRHLI